MNSFKQFGITSTQQAFTGDKIKISKVLNRQIIVHSHKVENSKYTGKCLYLQIELAGTKYVVFTGSKNLMDMMDKIPSNGFPFTATIVQENERYEFT